MQGRGAELRGTIEPDVVIHEGNPHHVQATYDYKFPCMNTGAWSRWRKYPEGPPHYGKKQGQLYEEAFGVKPVLVQPRVGVSR
jgi:hypothetical protein